MRPTAWILATAIATAAALLTACASGPSSAPSASSSTAPATAASAPGGRPAQNAATKAASAKANLAVEKLRLAELFKGTPVVIALQQDGNLRVDVPLHFSFDPGKSAVKPPLAAVLDRVASGQLDEITHLQISATGDAAGRSPPLVGERGASVRDYLIGRGLAASRLAVTSAVSGVVRVVVAAEAPVP